MSTSVIFRTMGTDQGVESYKETPGAVLLDVREPQEVAQGRIPGSINIPLSELNRVIDVAPTSDIPLFVYCHSGVRSRQAAQALAQAGYSNVTDIGGIVSYTGKME